MLRALWNWILVYARKLFSLLSPPPTSTIATNQIDPNSVVDYMKSRGMDSSLANRKILAKQYGYTGPLTGSAEMNIFLHQKLKNRFWP